MADICIIFASEDEALAGKLVALLRRRWAVWWAGDIAVGDWEREVRAQIENAKAVVPVFSGNTEGKSIFKDELKYASKLNRLIFPFFIAESDPPLGFGHLNRTEAFGWTGSETHSGFKQLHKKLAAGLREDSPRGKNPKRKSSLVLRGKSLQLPCFMFSLSSFETKVTPKAGLKLFEILQPAAGLISAYDAWSDRKDRVLLSGIRKLRESNCVLFLDSGNYEAYRKKDRYSNSNKDGWRRGRFREMAAQLSPDLSFAFDTLMDKGGCDEIAERVITDFRADERAIQPTGFSLCPIVHLPLRYEGTTAECATEILVKVARVLDPTMVAIPERELGNGLLERFRTVREIRKGLNGLGKYYPLHLLGTGNPISITALAAAGADSFDGLEWCRTVVDYDKGTLFHFQHFDCFRETYISSLQQKTRVIIEDPSATYGVQVLSYNLDFYTDWMRTIRAMIHSGQVEHLLKNVPNLGKTLFKELEK